jgi:L-threonylcarbamoyladenylate synthase
MAIYRAKTQVYQVNPAAIDPAVLQAAAETLRRGGLVAFPTETVYGLGANAQDAQAVAHIFAAKERPFFDPLIVHIASFEQLEDIAEAVPPLAWQLGKAFWPGPLTMVLKRGRRIPENVSAGRESVAVRLPAHPIPLALIRAAGLPIAAPSANRFSRPSPTTAQHVLEDLDGRVDMILDGGACPIGLESTVVDLLSDPPMILRPGGLALEVLQTIAPTIVVREAHFTDELGGASPGMLLKHYSPRARLLVFEGEPAEVCTRMQAMAEVLAAQQQRVGVMVADEQAGCFAELPVALQKLGSGERLEQIAANLFAAMRELDRQPVDVILAGTFSLEGLGLAIRDRLLRAAEGRVVKAG